jgi:positive regulator of sigma E activity
MSATLLYLVGYIIFVFGVAYGAHLMGVSAQWTATTVVILLGLGIAMAATKTRHREPPGET